MLEKLHTPRWAWVLTGSGHFFTESFELIHGLEHCDVFVSKAANEVLRMYKLKLDFPETMRVLHDKTASAVPVGLLYDHHYHTVVIAPATSNTVAKCACGISDSLPTNMLAQAGKLGIPGIVFACDTEPVVVTMSPHGWVRLMPRNIELENVERLRGVDHVRVACSIEQLRDELDRRLVECDLAWNTSSS